MSKTEFVLQEYMKLQKFDVIEVEMDFTPMDGIVNIGKITGYFIKHAENIPQGWIPTCYVILDNGLIGWIAPFRIENGKRINAIRFVSRQGNANNKEIIDRVMRVINAVQSDISNSLKLLQWLEDELNAIT